MKLYVLTYNIRLFNSPVTLDQAATSGRLLPLDEHYPGLGDARSYALIDPEDEIHAYDPFGVKVCGVLHQANVFTLPSAEYAAFTNSRLSFAAWETAQLIDLLLSPITPEAELESELFRIVNLDKVKRPESGCQNFHSTWLPDASRLCRDTTGWTLVLAFDTKSLLVAQAAHRSCHGIDIGISPLATVANGYDEHWQVPGFMHYSLYRSADGCTRDVHLRSRLLHLATYKAAQQQFEKVIARLIQEANAVVVEQLSLDELRQRIGKELDNRAVIDFLYSLLPQRLNLARIPLVRHPAAYTSRMCSCCYGYGLRQLQNWSTLRCENCDTEHDANVNAAKVLVHVGSYYALQRLRNNMGGEPHVLRRAL